MTKQDVQIIEQSKKSKNATRQNEDYLIQLPPKTDVIATEKEEENHYKGALS